MVSTFEQPQTHRYVCSPARIKPHRLHGVCKGAMHHLRYRLVAPGPNVARYIPVDRGDMAVYEPSQVFLVAFDYAPGKLSIQLKARNVRVVPGVAPSLW